MSERRSIKTTNNRGRTSLTDIVEKITEVEESLREKSEKNTYTLKFPVLEAEGVITVLEYALNVYISKAHSLKEELEKFKEAHPNFNFEEETLEEKTQEYLQKIVSRREDDKTIEELTKTHIDSISRGLDELFTTTQAEKNTIGKKPVEESEHKNRKNVMSKNPTLERYLVLNSQYEISLYQTAITKTILDRIKEYIKGMRQKNGRTKLKFNFQYDNGEYEIALQTYMNDFKRIVEETYNVVLGRIRNEEEKPEREKSGLWESKLNSLRKLEFSLLQVKRYFNKKNRE